MDNDFRSVQRQAKAVLTRSSQRVTALLRGVWHDSCVPEHSTDAYLACVFCRRARSWRRTWGRAPATAPRPPRCPCTPGPCQSRYGFRNSNFHCPSTRSPHVQLCLLQPAADVEDITVARRTGQHLTQRCATAGGGKTDSAAEQGRRHGAHGGPGHHGPPGARCSCTPHLHDLHHDILQPAASLNRVILAPE